MSHEPVELSTDELVCVAAGADAATQDTQNNVVTVGGVANKDSIKLEGNATYQAGTTVDKTLVLNTVQTRIDIRVPR